MSTELRMMVLQDSSVSITVTRYRIIDLMGELLITVQLNKEARVRQVPEKVVGMSDIHRY